MENFQLERSLIAIEKTDKSRDEKDNEIKSIFAESEKLNLRLAVAHIESITDGSDTETDNPTILEFIQNNDQEFYASLRKGIKDLTERWNLPNIDVTCTNEECEADSYNTKLDLDYSNFFGARSLNSRNLI